MGRGASEAALSFSSLFAMLRCVCFAHRCAVWKGARARVPVCVSVPSGGILCYVMLPVTVSRRYAAVAGLCPAPRWGPAPDPAGASAPDPPSHHHHACMVQTPRRRPGVRTSLMRVPAGGLTNCKVLPARSARGKNPSRSLSVHAPRAVYSNTLRRRPRSSSLLTCMRRPCSLVLMGDRSNITVYATKLFAAPGAVLRGDRVRGYMPNE